MKYEYKLLKFRSSISIPTIDLDVDAMSEEINKYAQEGWKITKVEFMPSNMLIVFMEREITS